MNNRQSKVTDISSRKPFVPQAATAGEQRRADLKASLRGMLQKASRLVESQRRLIMLEANVAAFTVNDENITEAFRALTIGNKHVEHDAAMLDAALEEVCELILN